MDTTIVVQAWTGAISLEGFVAALALQALIVGVAMAVGWTMGKT